MRLEGREKQPGDVVHLILDPGLRHDATGIAEENVGLKIVAVLALAHAVAGVLRALHGSMSAAI